MTKDDVFLRNFGGPRVQILKYDEISPTYPGVPRNK